jgi:hypothetical protein
MSLPITTPITSPSKKINCIFPFILFTVIHLIFLSLFSPACTRCKTLKVKCELKTDTDPCKRCIAAGKPCLTPGKRKRRTPPKREHLLNQIRDQAAQIQKLMSQLESSNKRKPAHRSSTSNSSDFELTSPVISPSSSASSYLPDLAAAAENTNSVNADVQDWLTKAKESIDAFGGFIGMGGGAVPKSFLLDEDPEDPVSSDDDYDYDDDVDGVLVTKMRSSVDGADDDDDNGDDDVDDDHDIDFTVADSDGSEPIDDSNGHWNNLALASRGPRPRTLTSSSAGATPSQRPKDLAGGGGMTDKPLAIYTKTSPFGLMVAMLNKKKHINRRSSDGGSDTAPDRDVGVAGDDFFSPSTDQLSDKPAPYILSHNIVTPKEVEKLFKMFFLLFFTSSSASHPSPCTATLTI